MERILTIMRRALGVVVAVVVALAAAPPATSDERSVRVELDRLTYIDGMHRDGTDPRFIRLGFNARRAASVVGAEVLDVHTPQMIATGEGPDHLHIVTVDVHTSGHLEVEMVPGTHPAYPAPVRGTASGDGRVRRGVARWTIPSARRESYTFSVQFRARVLDANLGSYLPETRITLRAGGEDRTLVLEQHAAPTYGSPRIDPGRAYGPAESPPRPDEWVAQPEWVAQGAYHWATGRVSAARDHYLAKLAPGADGAFNSASMGWASSGIPKVTPVTDFVYTRGSPRDFDLVGFHIGAATADLLGWFPPFTTSPESGRLYDGDGGTLGVTMSAGSAHWNKKARPTNDGGELRWDWDGAWAEGWVSSDAFEAPGIRGATQPIRMLETVLHAGAHGGDVDNRDGKGPVRGPRWYMDFPPAAFGFIGWGHSVPPHSKFNAAGGFTKDGRFWIRPVIGAGGYLIKAETGGYMRRWQPPILVGASFIGAQPDTSDRPEAPVATRAFLFPPGASGVISVATTTGLTKRFEVTSGIWQVTATLEDVELRRVDLL